MVLSPKWTVKWYLLSESWFPMHGQIETLSVLSQETSQLSRNSENRQSCIFSCKNQTKIIILKKMDLPDIITSPGYGLLTLGKYIGKHYKEKRKQSRRKK